MDDDELAVQFVQVVNVAGDDVFGDGLDGYGDQELYDLGVERRSVFALSRAEKGLIVTKEVLARRWGIGMDTAYRTLRVMT